MLNNLSKLRETKEEIYSLVNVQKLTSHSSTQFLTARILS